MPDNDERDTERLIPIREETGLPPPRESGTRPVLPAHSGFPHTPPGV